MAKPMCITMCPEGGDLQVKGYYFYSKRGLPGAVTLYNPVSNETLWDKNGFVQARYSCDFSSKWRFQTLGKYNYGWNRDREHGPQFAGGMYQAVHTQNEYYLSATAEYRPCDGSVVGSCTGRDSQHSQQHDGLVSLSYPLYIADSSHGTMAQGPADGYRHCGGDVYHRESQGGTAPEDIKRLSPSLSVSVQPWKEEMLFVRGMYKSTFRTPTFNDLYYDRLGNRSLRPERANEYDLGVTWSGKFCQVMDYFSVTADGYFNEVTDKIVAFPTTYAWKMANFGKVHVTGVDFTMATAFSLPRGINVSLSAAYTWQRAVDLTDPEAKKL